MKVVLALALMVGWMPVTSAFSRAFGGAAARGAPVAFKAPATAAGMLGRTALSRGVLGHSLAQSPGLLLA